MRKQQIMAFDADNRLRDVISAPMLLDEAKAFLAAAPWLISNRQGWEIRHGYHTILSPMERN